MNRQLLYNFIRRWFPLHSHVIWIRNIAIHKSEEDIGLPITAWRWECKLCGAIIDELSISGIEQLRKGNNIDDIMKWMRDEQKTTETYPN